jgi:preprotein translocase subunit SecG
MYTFLLVLLILDSAVLIAAILLQSGKGGGIAQSFGGVSSSTDAFIGTRQAGNLLTTVSWWAGGIFCGLAFVLQIMSTHARTPTSVLDKTFARPPASAPAPAPQSAAPAVPLAPAQPAQPAPSAPAQPPKK